MNKNIINIAFYISASELEDGPRDYRKTITNYRIAFGGTFNPPAVAYIKVPEENLAILPDVIDFMYDNNVIPVVAKEGFEMKLFREVERSKDILALMGQKEIFSSLYSFVVIDGWKVQCEQLGNCLSSAIGILEANDDMLSVSFNENVAGAPDGANFLVNQGFSFRPLLVRSRDFKIVARWVVDNSNQLVQLSSEGAFSVVFSKLSPHSMKFISFNPKIGYAL